MEKTAVDVLRDSLLSPAKLVPGNPTPSNDEYLRAFGVLYLEKSILLTNALEDIAEAAPTDDDWEAASQLLSDRVFSLKGLLMVMGENSPEEMKEWFFKYYPDLKPIDQESKIVVNLQSAKPARRGTLLTSALAPNNMVMGMAAPNASSYTQEFIRRYMNRDPAVIATLIRIQANPPTQEDYDALGPLGELVQGLVDGVFGKKGVEVYVKALEEHNAAHQALYRPEDDGVTHINVYSKGKTKLGKWLTNFSALGFEHHIFGKFASMEGYWYWLSTARRYDELRTVTGFEAKKLGRALSIKDEAAGETERDPHFKRRVNEGLLARHEQNPELAAMVKENTLPLTHYYVYGEGEKSVTVFPSGAEFVITYLERLHEYEHGRAFKVLTAGSQGITDYALMLHAHAQGDLAIVEVVNGLAAGVDTLGLMLAGQYDPPVRPFKPDWDKFGKPAGMIRNGEMGKYCQAAFILYDGVSPGTTGMIKIMKQNKKPMLVFSPEYQEIMRQNWPN